MPRLRPCFRGVRDSRPPRRLPVVREHEPEQAALESWDGRCGLRSRPKPNAVEWIWWLRRRRRCVRLPRRHDELTAAVPLFQFPRGRGVSTAGRLDAIVERARNLLFRALGPLPRGRLRSEVMPVAVQLFRQSCYTSLAAALPAGACLGHTAHSKQGAALIDAQPCPRDKFHAAALPQLDRAVPSHRKSHVFTRRSKGHHRQGDEHGEG